MRKKMTRVGLFYVGAMLVIVAIVSSCAKGFDGDETFTSTVKDSQLASPTLNESCFSSKVNADGTESVQVSWEVVPGAGGYYCHVDNVDDPANPVVVFDGNVDGTSFLFDKADDTKYSVSVKTLGNAKLNNKEATDATVFAYSTMVPAQVIPVGTDIADFINSHLIDTNDEQAFELQANGNYTLNSEVDFGTHKVTFRGDKVHAPIVTIGYDGVIRTAAGLKIKWIKFDCTEQNSRGVVECSINPPAELEATNFSGYPDKAYILKETILLQDCWFKNVKWCLFFTGQCAWGCEDVRVDNCLVQLDNNGNWGDAAVISGYTNGGMYKGSASSWNGAIRNLTIKNSTFYNIKDNAKNRFIRYTNSVRSGLNAIFDTASGSATFSNNTFVKTMSDKEFGNATPNNSSFEINFDGNILCISARISKFIQGNCKVNALKDHNTTWTDRASGDGTQQGADLNYCSEENPGFDLEQNLKPLDLNATNGGVNFKPSGAISGTIGDPRWLQ